MSIIYIPEISEHKVWVSDEIPEDAVFSYGGKTIGMTGKTHSEETKRKMSEAHKGNSRRRGIKASEESRKNMSEAHKGNRHSEETKRKMSASQKGRVVSEETRRKLSKSLTGMKYKKRNER